MEEENKQWIVPTEILEKIKQEIIDEVKDTSEHLLIRNMKTGMHIHMVSSKENMNDLIQKGKVIEVNFFTDKNGGKSYLG